MPFRSSDLLFGLLTFTTGCTSWSRLADEQPVPPRGQVQVWSGGEARLVHTARVVGDTFKAHAPPPDTSGIVMPLTAIDSLRIQHVDPGKAVIVGSGVAIVLFLAYLDGLQGMR